MNGHRLMHDTLPDVAPKLRFGHYRLKGSMAAKDSSTDCRTGWVMSSMSRVSDQFLISDIKDKPWGCFVKVLIQVYSME